MGIFGFRRNGIEERRSEINKAFAYILLRAVNDGAPDPIEQTMTSIVGWIYQTNKTLSSDQHYKGFIKRDLQTQFHLAESAPYIGMLKSYKRDYVIENFVEYLLYLEGWIAKIDEMNKFKMKINAICLDVDIGLDNWCIANNAGLCWALCLYQSTVKTMNERYNNRH